MRHIFEIGDTVKTPKGRGAITGKREGIYFVEVAGVNHAFYYHELNPA